VRLLALLPERPPAALLALGLNMALCSGLLSRSALEPLIGKTVALETRDLGTRVRVSYAARGFRAHSGRNEADVTIRASLSDFVSLALRRDDPDTLFFTRRLLITGDTELGLVVKNALDAVDWSRLPVPFGRR
jgi:O2-independent ubiquinone biosynthesis accessory factor UbiT